MTTVDRVGGAVKQTQKHRQRKRKSSEPSSTVAAKARKNCPSSSSSDDETVNSVKLAYNGRKRNRTLDVLQRATPTSIVVPATGRVQRKKVEKSSAERELALRLRRERAADKRRSTVASAADPRMVYIDFLFRNAPNRALERPTERPTVIAVSTRSSQVAVQDPYHRRQRRQRRRLTSPEVGTTFGIIAAQIAARTVAGRRCGCVGVRVVVAARR